MADFEPPSFSLGLDYDLPQTTQDTHPSSSNHLSVPFSTFEDSDEEFEALVVEDSDHEYPDSHPKLKRLRRGPTVSKAESHSTAVSHTDQNHHTQHHVLRTSLNDQEPVSASCNNAVFTKLTASPVRGFCLTDSDLDSYYPVVRRKCNGSDPNSNLGKRDDLPQHVKRKENVSNAWEDFPNAYRYFFHDDPRIQQLVRSRLPNFFPLGNMLNIDIEQPGASKIDYMGQFSFVESSKQAARIIKEKKSSTSRKKSRKLNTEELTQGWVNPKLGVDKVTTKGDVKRKAHAARQSAGHWLTGSDGKKVYVGKSGQELTGRVAYMLYKKESGLGFRKVKRKSVTKKKK